jgi:hypothetical protein
LLPFSTTPPPCHIRAQSCAPRASTPRRRIAENLEATHQPQTPTCPEGQAKAANTDPQTILSSSAPPSAAMRGIRASVNGGSSRRDSTSRSASWPHFKIGGSARALRSAVAALASLLALLRMPQMYYSDAHFKMLAENGGGMWIATQLL